MEEVLVNQIVRKLFEMGYGRRQFLDFCESAQRDGRPEKIQKLAQEIGVSVNILRVFWGHSKREQKQARQMSLEAMRKINANYTVLVTDDCQVLETLGYKTGNMEMAPNLADGTFRLILEGGKQRIMLIRDKEMESALREQYGKFCDGAVWVADIPLLKKGDEVCLIKLRQGRVDREHMLPAIR